MTLSSQFQHFSELMSSCLKRPFSTEKYKRKKWKDFIWLQLQLIIFWIEPCKTLKLFKNPWILSIIFEKNKTNVFKLKFHKDCQCLPIVDGSRQSLPILDLPWLIITNYDKPWQSLINLNKLWQTLTIIDKPWQTLTILNLTFSNLKSLLKPQKTSNAPKLFGEIARTLLLSPKSLYESNKFAFARKLLISSTAPQCSLLIFGMPLLFRRALPFLKGNCGK